MSSAAADFIRRGVDAGWWDGALVATGNAERETGRIAAGDAWRTANRPMRPDAIFDIASLTKVVAVAVPAVMLAAAGRLELDRPFTDYLPAYRGRLFQPVTVCDLALHQSGFDNNRSFLAAADNAALHRGILALSPVRPPRSRVEYACTNFLLLAKVLEEITGRRLDQLAAKLLLRPLGMTETTWGSRPDDGRRLVKAVNVERPGIVSDEIGRQSTGPVGNSGLFSTATDLGRFARFLLKDSEALPPAARRELFRRQTPDGQQPRTFGWRIGAGLVPAGLSDRTVYHSGWTGQTLWVDPATRRYILVMTSRIGKPETVLPARVKLAELALQEI